MIQQTFIKDQNFTLSAPADYGIQPPPGKTAEDFIGWRGCDPSNVDNYFKSDLEKTLLAGSVVKYSDPSKIPCYYPVWNKYGWTYAEGQTSADFYIYTTNSSPSNSRKSYAVTITEPKYNYPANHKIRCLNDSGKDGYAYLSSGQVIFEGGKIQFEVCNSPGKTLSNLYINGQLFAGIDVDAEYWEAHKNDLYRLLPDSLSVNFCKDAPLTAENGYWAFSFNITSCHVSSDNLMHLSCDVDTIGGTVNLYESLDESL